MCMAYKDPLDERARAARRRHYDANKQQYLDRNKASTKACVDLIRAAKDVPCADCGLRYPHYVMDLDHLDPSTKLGTVGQMARRGIRKTQEEIAKCEAVCANCHRERTHRGVPPGGGQSPKLTENKQQSSTLCTPVG